MNKLNIQHCLERKKELFQKYDINYIINNSSKIETNDIYDLRLDEKIFNIDENNYYSIFIVIVDKENNNILESRNINKNFKNKKINLNIRHIVNDKILDNYLFYISIIPVIEEKKEIIKDFIKIFYEPVKLLPKNKIIENKFEIISILVLIFSIFITITQVEITNKLIDNYGFVDTLINNVSIFNSIIYYFYDNFLIKNFSPLFLMYLIILVVLLIPSFINFVIDLFIFLWKRSCRFYKSEYLYLKIKLNNDLYDIKSNFKEVYYNPSFLFIYTLMYILLMILLFAPIMKIFSDENIKVNLNYKGKIIERYFESSNFPNFMKLKILESNEIDVFMIGYDNTYTYYYNYEYIKEKLNKKFKPFDENSKDDRRKMNISEVYAYYLNDLSNKELRYIKNVDYKIINTLEEKYYEIKKK